MNSRKFMFVGILLVLVGALTACLPVPISLIPINWMPEDGVWYCEELQIQLSFEEDVDSYVIVNGERKKCSWCNEQYSRILWVDFDEDDDGYLDDFYFSGERVSLDDGDDEFVLRTEEGEEFVFVRIFSQKPDDELYYLITEENGLFSYTIFDKKMNAVRTEKNLTKRPKIGMTSDCVIYVAEQAGTGIATSTTYFYDVENNQFSDSYAAVLDQANGLVVYAESDKVIVRDVFDDYGFYQEIIHFGEMFSPAAFPFVGAEFVDDATAVRVTYLAGEDYTEMSEVFELQVG